MNNRTAFGEIPNTPNVVIKNPDVRLWVGGVLYALSLLAAIAALFFSFFPELGSDVSMRSVSFMNALVALLAGAFGLIVTTPNVPRPTPSDHVEP